MRVWAVAVAVVLLAGCFRQATGQKPDPTMLSDALPTIADMPGTWQETQRQAFTQRGNENPSIDPSVWCPQASSATTMLVTLAGQSGADVEMALAESGEGQRMMRLQAWSNDEVRAYMGDVKTAAGVCDGTTSTDETGVKMTFDSIDNRSIGDDSVSWSQRTTVPSGGGKTMDSVGRTTVARFGDILMVLQLGDAVDAGAVNPLSEDDWWTIVKMAGKKLHDLDKQVHD